MGVSGDVGPGRGMDDQVEAFVAGGLAVDGGALVEDVAGDAASLRPPGVVALGALEADGQAGGDAHVVPAVEDAQMVASCLQGQVGGVPDDGDAVAQEVLGVVDGEAPGDVEGLVVDVVDGAAVPPNRRR